MDQGCTPICFQTARAQRTHHPNPAFRAGSAFSAPFTAEWHHVDVRGVVETWGPGDESALGLEHQRPHGRGGRSVASGGERKHGNRRDGPELGVPTPWLNRS